jgi:hypothetical protein
MSNSFVKKVCCSLFVSPLLFLGACSTSSKSDHQILLADATRHTSKELIQAKVKIKSIDSKKAAINWVPTNEITYINRTVYKEQSNRFVFIPTHLLGFSSITSYLSYENK